MYIEIVGTGQHNKGAEMMLITILQQLKHDEFKFVFAPSNYSGGYDFYAKLGVYQKFRLPFKSFDFDFMGDLIPKKLRKLYGIVLNKEIKCVIDASGFRLSEQWGDNFILDYYNDIIKWKKQNKKIILMPQSFGPFIKENNKKLVYEIIQKCDLIFARDANSYKLLKSINNNNNIFLYPDFTSLLKVKIPSYFNNSKNNKICLVPNKRILDKGNISLEVYKGFFIQVINELLHYNYEPFFLIHGGEDDKKLAIEINNNINAPIDIIIETNALFVKGIISKSTALVGSRYHGIASALYSNKVAIGIGWSHKYEALYKDMNFHEGLLKDLDSTTVNKSLESIINQSQRKKIEYKLKEAKINLDTTSLEMFQKIKDFLKVSK